MKTKKGEKNEDFNLFIYYVFLVLCIPVSAGVRLASTTSVPDGTIYCFESSYSSVSCVFVPTKK